MFGRSIRISPMALAVAGLLIGLVSPAAAQPAAGQGKPPRPSIAVAPLAIAADAFWACQDKNDVYLLADKVGAALLASGKFDVIERPRVDSVLNEQELVQEGRVDPARAARVGKLIGADYLLVGSVSLFSAGIDYRKIPYLSRYNAVRHADAVVDFQLIETESGKIVAARRVDAYLRDRLQPVETPDPSVPKVFLDDFQREIAGRLSEGVLDALYPVKIVESRSGTFFLNRGSGGGVAVGQIWKVFLAGGQIRDRATGESLGTDDSEVGTLRVTECHEQFSKAVAESGWDYYPAGAVCRRAIARPGEIGPPEAGN